MKSDEFELSTEVYKSTEEYNKKLNEFTEQGFKAFGYTLEDVKNRADIFLVVRQEFNNHILSIFYQKIESPNIVRKLFVIDSSYNHESFHLELETFPLDNREVLHTVSF